MLSLSCKPIVTINIHFLPWNKNHTERDREWVAVNIHQKEELELCMDDAGIIFTKGASNTQQDANAAMTSKPLSTLPSIYWTILRDPLSFSYSNRVDRLTNDTTVTGLFCTYERTLTDNARGLYYTSVLKIVLRSAKMEPIIACTHAVRQKFINSGFEFISLSRDMLTEYFWSSRRVIPSIPPRFRVPQPVIVVYQLWYMHRYMSLIHIIFHIHDTITGDGDFQWIEIVTPPSRGSRGRRLLLRHELAQPQFMLK